jgi:heme oxygenase (mycobilin-producing)
MLAVAISTVEVHASFGKSETVGVQLFEMVEMLRDSSDCLSYLLSRDEVDGNLWIITAHWQSADAMQAHFKHPAFDGFMALLHRCLVRRIEFNSEHLQLIGA